VRAWSNDKDALAGTASKICGEEEAMARRKKQSLLDQAADYIDQVRPQVESAVASALDAAEDFYEKTARPALVDAREKAGPALADAREKAAPYVAEARERATAALADAREQAGPLVAAGAERASEVAAQAKEAADAKVAQLRGEDKKKKGGKLRKLAIFAALAGVAGFIAKKLQGGGQSANWQSSYVPTPAPGPGPATDDAGAAGPDEAISDAADEPQPVTTPDEPADVVDLESPVEDAPKKK
jgi:ElaB/YqjD/DUF883 family membrane-anchored ribosome-binding protein